MKVGLLTASLTVRSAFLQILLEMSSIRELVKFRNFEDIDLDGLSIIIIVCSPSDQGTEQFLKAQKEELKNCAVLLYYTENNRDLMLNTRLKKLGVAEVLSLPMTDTGNIDQKALASDLKERVQHLQDYFGLRQQEVESSLMIRQSPMPGYFDILCIGISTGGPAALKQMLPKLLPQVELPIVIVQHMPGHMENHFTNSLDGLSSNYGAHLAKNGEVLRPRNIYVAPVGTQLKISVGLKNYKICRLTDDPPINDFKPSADALFESAGKVFGMRALGLIMTGMGDDGAKGLVKLKGFGGTVVAQDESSSVVWGMPGNAVKLDAVNLVCDLLSIPDKISELCNKGLA